MLQKPSKIRATAGHGNSGWLSRGGGWPAVWRPPHRRAPDAPVHLRRHDTLARDAGRPGRTRGPAAARIIRVCGQQGVPAWPDRARQGAGPRSPPGSNGHPAANHPTHHSRRPCTCPGPSAPSNAARHGPKSGPHQPVTAQPSSPGPSPPCTGTTLNKGLWPAGNHVDTVHTRSARVRGQEIDHSFRSVAGFLHTASGAADNCELETGKA